MLPNYLRHPKWLRISKQVHFPKHHFWYLCQNSGLLSSLKRTWQSCKLRVGRWTFLLAYFQGRAVSLRKDNEGYIYNYIHCYAVMPLLRHDVKPQLSRWDGNNKWEHSWFSCWNEQSDLLWLDQQQCSWCWRRCEKGREKNFILDPTTAISLLTLLCAFSAEKKKTDPTLYMMILFPDSLPALVAPMAGMQACMWINALFDDSSVEETDSFRIAEWIRSARGCCNLKLGKNSVLSPAGPELAAQQRR